MKHTTKGMRNSPRPGFQKWGWGDLVWSHTDCVAVVKSFSDHHPSFYWGENWGGGLNDWSLGSFSVLGYDVVRSYVSNIVMIVNSQADGRWEYEVRTSGAQGALRQTKAFPAEHVAFGVLPGLTFLFHPFTLPPKSNERSRKTSLSFKPHVIHTSSTVLL